MAVGVAPGPASVVESPTSEPSEATPRLRPVRFRPSGTVVPIHGPAQPGASETARRASRVHAPSVATSLRCYSITTTSAFAALEGNWRELLSQAGNPSPFFSWEFALEWFRHFVRRRVGGATGDFEVVVVVDGAGREVAIAPFYLERNLGFAAFGTILQPFGRSNSFEPMTDEPITIFRCGFETRAALAIRDHLLQRREQRTWDVAALYIPAGDDDLKLRLASSAFPNAAGALGVVRPAAGPLTVSLPPSWPAFLTRLSKSMRDNIAYYPRKLSRELGEWSISVARSPEDVAVAARKLVSLHRARSHAIVGVPHADHIPTEAHSSFLEAWGHRAAVRRQMSIISLSVGDEVIAAQAFVEGPSVVSVYYSGFDERYHRYGPLTVINAEMARLSIERGLGRIEYPPGLQPWKCRWNAREEKNPFEVSFYSTRPGSLVRGVARGLYFRLKTG